MSFYVIGEEEIVIGFRFAGVEGRAVTNREEALDAFREAVERKDLRVLIITEEVSLLLDQEVTQHQLEGAFPLVAEVPGLAGHISGKKTLLDSIREAIGIRV